MKFSKNLMAVLAVFLVLVAFGFIKPIAALAAGPGPVNIRSIGTNNFVILGETWITDVPISAITGNIGVSAATGAQIGVTCAEMTGTSKIYEVDAGYVKADMSCVESGPGAKTIVDDAVIDMGAAYTEAYTTTTPSVTTDYLGLGGILPLGTTFAPGIYKWGTDVNITGNITLNGGADEVWIFQIAGDLNVASEGDLASGVHIILSGGAKASNVFWAVAGGTGATLGTYSTFNGTILSAKQVILLTGAVLNGRALAQTQVVLQKNFINTATSPKLTVTKTVINDNGGIKVVANFPLFIDGISTPSGAATTVSIGLHTVSETSDAGYAATIGGDCAADGTVTLADGNNKTCTIINNDVLPGHQLLNGTINVVKTVVNDSGGIKTVADFPLFINGALVTSGITNTFLAPAIYTVTETADPNYTRTFSGDCNSSGIVNLTTNADKFCIITNNDIGAPLATPPVPPLIDVVKVPSPLALPAGPGAVTYTYTLRNVGMVPATDITMVGDTCSPIILVSGDTNNDAKLDVSETWVYTCSTTLSATHTNTVVATGWANGISATDIASATVVVGAPVVPPLIHLVKKPSVFTLAAPGGAVTYTYTVTNPGTEPLSNVNITDNKCTGLPGRVSGHPGDINKNDLLESNETWSFTCQSNLTQTTTNTGTASGEANGLTARDFAIATVVVAAAVPTPIVPKLPNTGIAPMENPNLWPIVAAGIFAVSFLLYVIRKKQIIY